jgi:iron-sulfur cluster repair protein YtfE (RIC family)
MLNTIGAPRPSEGIVELLLECHARIRSFSDLAVRLGEAPAPSPAEVADAAARVRRYFAEALPLHARDEEESVLPRLRGRDPAVDAELLAMAREHAEHEAPVAALTGACDEIARDPTRAPALLRGVGRAAAELERHFAAHLRREESVIFPALRRLLDPAADAEIVREIRARRGAGSIPTASPTR